MYYVSSTSSQRSSILSCPPVTPMRPVRRMLECSQCGMNYSTIYRGRRPLCKACRSAHFKDEQQPQASIMCSTSFSQLPTDVLDSLVPHLLMRRMPAQPYEWAVSTFMEDMLLCKNLPLSHRPNWREVRYVARYAWLPTLRIKLVCKSLQRAVDAYLSSLVQSEPRYIQAAVSIQRAVKANLSMNSSWFQEMQATWNWTRIDP